MSTDVGIGVAVVDGFEITREEARGAAPGTLFQAGSISKPVAALTALQLVEEGVLDLDAELNDGLRSWKLNALNPVTLRHVLSHTAGIGVEFFPGYSASAPVPSVEQILDGLPPANTKPVRVEGDPGVEFRYSGGGYLVLQLLMTDVTGMPFSELATRLVFEPLGMEHSTFEQPLPEPLHPAAASPSWHIYPEAAAAGLWTTASDLARFCICLQRALAGLPAPISSETASLMTTPQVELPPNGEWAALRTLGVEPPDRFGMGLFLGGDWFSHLGSSAGFVAALWGSTEDGTGAVVTANNESFPFVFRVLLEIADEYEWPGVRAGAESQ